MKTTAEALANIRKLTEAHGTLMTAAEVMPNPLDGSQEIGQVYDITSKIAIAGINRRLVPTGVVEADVSCRTIAVLPSASRQFTHDETNSPLTVIRQKLAYNQPDADLSRPGRVTHMAAYFLRPEDCDALDANGGVYDAMARKLDGVNVEEEELNRRAWWKLDEPDLPADKADQGIAPQEDRYDMRLSVVMEAQRQFTGVNILSGTNYGAMYSSEIPTLAIWMINQSTIS